MLLFQKQHPEGGMVQLLETLDNGSPPYGAIANITFSFFSVVEFLQRFFFTTEKEE